MHWRWRDIEPFTERAAKEVAIEDVERRALILANPAFGGATVTTQNLIGAFTVLEPGDKAVPHRHTAAAIRFSTRAEGAVTIVNGRRCEMKEGDLVLTPPMCWHGHINQGEPAHRLVRRRQHAGDLRARRELLRARHAPGRALLGSRATRAPQEYRFPGSETRGELESRRAGADGARTFRYTKNGGSVMPTLDLFLQAIERDRRGRDARPTTPSAWSSRAKAARPSASRPSSGRSTTCSPSRTGPGRATRRAAQRRPLRRHRPRDLRATRAAARRARVIGVVGPAASRTGVSSTGSGRFIDDLDIPGRAALRPRALAARARPGPLHAVPAGRAGPHRQGHGGRRRRSDARRLACRRACSSCRAGRSRATRCATSASRWPRCSRKRAPLAEDAAERVERRLRSRLPLIEDESASAGRAATRAAVEAAFATAPQRVEIELVNNRLCGAAIENARRDLGPATRCTAATQAPHHIRALRLRGARHRRGRAARRVARHGRRLRLQGQALSRRRRSSSGRRAGCAGR